MADCDVLLYQAGADPHINDPLGGWLTTAQLRERDRIAGALDGQVLPDRRFVESNVRYEALATDRTPPRVRARSLWHGETEYDGFLHFIPTGAHCVLSRWSPAAPSRSLA
jgi:hypothetical protein